MNKKIKVIELINSIVDAGAETIVKDIAINLDPSKYDVYILTETANSTKHANVRSILEKGVKLMCVYPLATSKFTNKLYRKLYEVIVPSRYRIEKQKNYIESVIRDINPDVIHVHLQMIQYLIPISDYLRKNNTRIIYSCYTVPSRYFNNKSMRENFINAKYLICNNNMRFTAMHESMKDELNQLFGVSDTVILRNGIDLSIYNNLIGKTEARKRLGIPTDSFVVGHLGRFIYIKNQSFLIDVFKEILSVNKMAFLVMVGDGKDLAKVKKKIRKLEISDRCLILSHVNCLVDFYKSIDVFVFPSLFEGIPNACIEAQAAGLKCVISSTITKDVFFSSKAIPACLEDGPAAWARKILDSNVRGEFNNDIGKFDVKNVASNLDKLYLE